MIDYDEASDAGETDDLQLAIEDARAQLKVMWALRKRLHRMAQAAAMGASVGLAAVFGIGGYIAWQIERTGRAGQVLASPDTLLLVEFGLIVIILLMSGYLWFRGLAARDSGAALAAEIETVRSALQRAAEANDFTSAAEARG